MCLLHVDAFSTGSASGICASAAYTARSVVVKSSVCRRSTFKSVLLAPLLCIESLSYADEDHAMQNTQKTKHVFRPSLLPRLARLFRFTLLLFSPTSFGRTRAGRKLCYNTNRARRHDKRQKKIKKTNGRCFWKLAAFYRLVSLGFKRTNEKLRAVASRGLHDPLPRLRGSGISEEGGEETRHSLSRNQGRLAGLAASFSTLLHQGFLLSFASVLFLFWSGIARFHLFFLSFLSWIDFLPLH